MYIHGGLSTEFYFDQRVLRVHDRVCTEVLMEISGFGSVDSVVVS